MRNGHGLEPSTGKGARGSCHRAGAIAHRSARASRNPSRISRCFVLAKTSTARATRYREISYSSSRSPTQGWPTTVTSRSRSTPVTVSQRCGWSISKTGVYTPTPRLRHRVISNAAYSQHRECSSLRSCRDVRSICPAFFPRPWGTSLRENESDSCAMVWLRQPCQDRVAAAYGLGGLGCGGSQPLGSTPQLPSSMRRNAACPAARATNSRCTA
jgi:hypothetical protein